VAEPPRAGAVSTDEVIMEPGLASKLLEPLKEIAPRVSRVAFLFNPTTAPYAPAPTR
jgi:putative tryptophan/tyrosine transport system substrate-binding protein